MIKNVYRSAVTLRKLSWPEQFLVMHLKILEYPERLSIETYI